jgi:hypothetical protein
LEGRELSFKNKRPIRSRSILDLDEHQGIALLIAPWVKDGGG